MLFLMNARVIMNGSVHSLRPGEYVNGEVNGLVILLMLIVIRTNKLVKVNLFCAGLRCHCRNFYFVFMWHEERTTHELVS